MTLPVARITRAFSRAEEAGAARMLGTDHGLVRSLARQHALSRQLLVIALPLLFGVAGTVKQIHPAPAVLGAAGIVEVVLLGTFLLTRSLVRERAQELIGAAQADDAIPVIANERRRLLSKKERERLARSLERALHAAEHWEEILPSFRPPQGIRLLRFTAREVREIAWLLRSNVDDARGVALTARFLAGGEGTSLCRGDVVALRQELNRIRHFLEGA
jgi:hypothetical protein